MFTERELLKSNYFSNKLESVSKECSIFNHDVISMISIFTIPYRLDEKHTVQDMYVKPKIRFAMHVKVLFIYTSYWLIFWIFFH